MYSTFNCERTADTELFLKGKFAMVRCWCGWMTIQTFFSNKPKIYKANWQNLFLNIHTYLSVRTDIPIIYYHWQNIIIIWQTSHAKKIHTLKYHYFIKKNIQTSKSHLVWITQSFIYFSMHPFPNNFIYIFWSVGQYIKHGIYLMEYLKKYMLN